MAPPRAKAFARLQTLLREAESIDRSWIGGRRLIEWKLSVEIALTRILGDDSICLRRFRELHWPTEELQLQAWEQTVDEARAILTAALGDVTEFEPSAEANALAKADTLQSMVTAELRRWPQPLRAIVLILVLAIASTFAIWQSLPNETKGRFLRGSSEAPLSASTAPPATSSVLSAGPDNTGTTQEVADQTSRSISTSQPLATKPETSPEVGSVVTRPVSADSPAMKAPVDRFVGRWRTADGDVDLNISASQAQALRREGSLSIRYERLQNQPFACAVAFGAAIAEHDGKTWLQLSNGRFQDPAMSAFCHMQPDGELWLNWLRDDSFEAKEGEDVIFAFTRKDI